MGVFRVCTICKKEQDVSAFFSHRDKKSGVAFYRFRCHSCINKQNRGRYAKKTKRFCIVCGESIVLKGGKQKYCGICKVQIAKDQRKKLSILNRSTLPIEMCFACERKECNGGDILCCVKAENYIRRQNDTNK